MPSYAIDKSTNIYLLKDVPLDAEYEHTVLFASANAQYSALMTYRAFTFTENSYTRHSKGKIRVQTPYNASLFDCNYLAFQNTQFENKWVYCFITDSEYINNNTAEITYEIDVMQTFMFDYDLGQCFVEREHTLTDYIGDNTTDEGLETGDLICNTSITFNYPYSGVYGSIANYLRISYVPNEKRIGAWYFDGTGGYAGLPVVNYDPVDDPTLIGGVMSCGQIGTYCYLIIPIVNNADALTRMHYMMALKKLQSISAIIVSVDGIPAEMFTDYYSTSSESLAQTPAGHTNSMTELTTFRDRSGNVSNDYTPKNKKLYCFPYRQLIMTNSAGKSNTLKWELFSTRSGSNMPQAEFKKQNFVIPTASAYLYPKNYRGIPDDYLSGLSVENFPQYPWSEDAYTKWIAQNSSANSTKIVASVISTAISFGLGAAVAAVAPPAAGAGLAVAGLGGSAVNRGISTVASVTAQRQTAQCTPDSSCGSAERNDIPLVNEELGFHIYDMCVTAEFARRIDSFLSMYGYKINQVKIPNIQASPISGLRPQWNYVKLGECVIKSKAERGLMQKYENKISDIYKKGITFWMSTANVGNYSLANDPPI